MVLLPGDSQTSSSTAAATGAKSHNSTALPEPFFFFFATFNNEYGVLAPPTGHKAMLAGRTSERLRYPPP